MRHYRLRSLFSQAPKSLTSRNQAIAEPGSGFAGMRVASKGTNMRAAWEMRVPSFDPGSGKRRIESPTGPSLELFAPIDSRRFSWRALAASSGLHTLVLTVLIALPLARPIAHLSQPIVYINPQSASHLPEQDLPMTLPYVPPSKPVKTPAHEFSLPRAQPKPPPKPVPLIEKNPAPDLKVPRPIEMTAPPPRPVEPVAPPAPSPVPVNESPKPAVQTNVFSNPAAQGTVRRAPQEVQTGGFGNPAGIEPRAAAGGTDKIPQMGSFDAADGPGRGNGTGGRKGVQGTTASARFGNGVVSPDGAGTSKDGSGRGAVRSGGFGDYGDPGGTGASPHGTRAASPDISPVEIVYKPKPVYSQKAREMKLEGEVLVEVMFKASGQIQVLRLVQGLGSGLDEEGIRAAQLIRFKPAQQDGKSVDSRAIVHIIFRLS